MVAATPPRRPRGGRAASPDTKKPMGGKGSQLLTRVSQELRDVLEAEAERSGRSLSRVAEGWLEDARAGRASAESILGGGDVAPALRAMAAAAAEIEGMYGPPSSDWRANAATLGAWNAIARALLPKPGPSAEEMEMSTKAKLANGSEAQSKLETLRQERQIWLRDYAAGAADAYAERLEAVRLEPAPADES